LFNRIQYCGSVNKNFSRKHDDVLVVVFAFVFSWRSRQRIGRGMFGSWGVLDGEVIVLQFSVPSCSATIELASGFPVKQVGVVCDDGKRFVCPFEVGLPMI
jgi:hypothetical protein